MNPKTFLIFLFLLLVLTACSPAAIAIEMPVAIPTPTLVPPTGTATPMSSPQPIDTATPSPTFTAVPSLLELIYSPFYMVVSGDPIYFDQECNAISETWITDVVLAARITNSDGTAYRGNIPIDTLPVKDTNRNGKIDSIEVVFFQSLTENAFLQATLDAPDLMDPAAFTHTLRFQTNLAEVGNPLNFQFWIRNGNEYVQGGAIGGICTLRKDIVVPTSPSRDNNGGGGHSGWTLPPTPAETPIE